MKNKNTNTNYNEFEKNKDLTLFESKFVYLQGHHLPDKDWVQPTEVEEGQATAESIVNKFDQSEIPNAETNVDTVVFGVRKSLMQGPLDDLNAENILDHRVRSRLEYVRRNAPEFYKYAIDEQVRARTATPPGALGTIWNAVTFKRWRMENEISRELFTYNMERGENYMTLLNNITPQIQALGNVMVNGTNINFGSVDAMGNPNEVTTFAVAVGPAGAPANKQVVIRWFQHDYITIKKNLIKAGVWEEFMGLAQGRNFMLLKFRYSELDRVNNEEKAKLSNERFRPQRLQTWLDNDGITQALQDQTFQDWVTRNSSDPLVVPPRPLGPNMLDNYADADALQTGNPALFRQMQRQQELAKQRVSRNTLEQMLRDILTPNQLEQLHKSDEVKAMLAYLQAEMNDSLEGPEVREFIRNLAGRTDDLDNLTNEVKTWEDAEKVILATTKDFNAKYVELGALPQKIIDQRAAIAGAAGGRNSAEAIEKMNSKLSALLDEQTKLQIELVDNVWPFIKFLQDQTAPGVNSPVGPKITNLNNSAVIGAPAIAGARRALSHPHLANRPKNNAEIGNFLQAFSDLYSQGAFENSLDTLSTNVTGQKLKLQNQLQAAQAQEGKTEKMDARGLLYRLVERDLKEKGVTEQNGIQQKSLYATNILIAKSRNTDIYGQTNKQVAKTIEGSWLGRHFRSDAGNLLPDGILPVLSAKDILSHLADEPGFEIFHNMNVFSSVKDLRKMMARYGMADPAKLRELQEKIGLFISGVEVPTEGQTIGTTVRNARQKIADTLHVEDLINRYSKRKPVYGKTYRVRSEEAPLLENMMHVFELLEAELSSRRRLANIEDDIADKVEKGEAVNRSEVILKNLQEQTEDSRDMDAAVSNAVESQHAPFRKRLIFKDLRNNFYEAMAETEGMPSNERDEYLASKGFNERVRSRGLFSLRTRWWSRKIGGAAITLPFKAIAGGLGGIKNFVKWGYHKLYNAETWKKSNESTKEQWKSIFRAPFTVAGAILVNYPAKILSIFPRMLDKTAVKSTNKSYAAINRDVVTS